MVAPKNSLIMDAIAEPFVLVAPNIRSAHNVGALLRTADGAGVSRVYLTGFTPQPHHPKVAKVSLGAEHFVPWEHRAQTARVLKNLQAAGYHVVALEKTRNSVNMYSWQPQFPLALVVGSEVDGIQPQWLRRCAAAIEIPMRGHKNSLNVSIAAGIALYYIGHHL